MMILKIKMKNDEGEKGKWYCHKHNSQKSSFPRLVKANITANESTYLAFAADYLNQLQKTVNDNYTNV